MILLPRLALLAGCALLAAIWGGAPEGRPPRPAPEPGSAPAGTGVHAPPDTSFEAFWHTVREALRADDAEALSSLIADEFLVEDVLSITSAAAFVDLYHDLFPADVRDVFLTRTPEPSDLVEGDGRVLRWDDGAAQRLFLVLRQADGTYRLAGFYPSYDGE